MQIVVCSFVLFLLVIVLSVLFRYMDSDYLPLVSSNSTYIDQLLNCLLLPIFFMSIFTGIRFIIIKVYFSTFLGLCIIINNRNFRELTSRNGSDIDASK